MASSLGASVFRRSLAILSKQLSRPLQQMHYHQGQCAEEACGRGICRVMRCYGRSDLSMEGTCVIFVRNRRDLSESPMCML